MLNYDLVMHEGEFRKVNDELKKLYELSNAKVLFLVDKNGQLIDSVGDTHDIDTTALASLTAGNIAATGGIAQLLGEREFTILFHEGEKDNIHISLIGQRIILAVIFDQKSSLGLVRLRVKRATERLTRIFEDIAKKSDEARDDANPDASSLAELTDEDIDRLFG